MLTILMFSCKSSKVIKSWEAEPSTAGVVGKPVEVKPEAQQMMEHYLKRNKRSGFAALVALTPQANCCGCSGQAYPRNCHH